MAIRLKPKSFGPLTLEQAREGRFVYTSNGGHQVAAGLGDHKEHSAPSDLILGALGSCLGLSFQVAAQQMKIDAGRVSLEVRAEKATDLPSRFGSFAVKLALPDVSDQDVAQKLVKAAKEMCTVSNTLNAEVTIELVNAI